MAFTVEDGTIVEGANSYVSEDEADAYFADRQNFDWLSGDKQSTLIKATAYIENRYRGKWKGRITDRYQPLAWPRRSVRDEEGRRVASDEIPQRLKDAVCEAAFRAVTAELDPDVATTERVVTKEQVGDLVVEYEPAETHIAVNRPVYRIVDDLLGGLVTSGGGSLYGFVARA